MGYIPFHGPAAESLQYRELERLVVAGAIDRQLQALLIHDLEYALEAYARDHFVLPLEQKVFIKSLAIDDYQGFVNRIAQWIQVQSHGEAGEADD